MLPFEEYGLGSRKGRESKAHCTKLKNYVWRISFILVIGMRHLAVGTNAKNGYASNSKHFIRFQEKLFSSAVVRK